MTREEIKNMPALVDLMLDKCVLADSRTKVCKRLKEVCNLAIKALEQEPCEDCISRRAVLEIAKSSKSNWIDNSVLFKRVNKLPPVNPQPKIGHCMDFKHHKEAHDDEGIATKNIAKAFQLGVAFGFGEKYDEINRVIDEIKKVVTPQQKIGYWEWVQYDSNPNVGNWCCSECRSVVIECGDKKSKGDIPLYKYCPQCGAKMIEPQKRMRIDKMEDEE